MKKKIVSMVLAVMMAASLTTACGGDNKKAADTSSTAKTQTATPAASTDTKTETPAPAAKDDTAAASTDGETVSDEVFAQMQDCYDLMVQYYNAAVDLYSDDAVAASEEVNDVMSQAKEIIEEMGEITQDSLTPDDAVELIDAMEIIVDVLSETVDGMELTDDADAADGEMVSDETFATLQANYEDLTTVYNIIAEAYNNGAEENADIVDTMNQAYEIIEQMGEITQDSITEADAEALINSMVEIVEVLAVVADAM